MNQDDDLPPITERVAGLMLADGAQLLLKEEVNAAVNQLHAVLRNHERHPGQSATALMVMAGAYVMATARPGTQEKVMEGLCTALRSMTRKYLQLDPSAGPHDTPDETVRNRTLH